MGPTGLKNASLCSAACGVRLERVAKVQHEHEHEHEQRVRGGREGDGRERGAKAIWNSEIELAELSSRLSELPSCRAV
jgi:hypothetical protein